MTYFCRLRSNLNAYHQPESGGLGHVTTSMFTTRFDCLTACVCWPVGLHWTEKASENSSEVDFEVKMDRGPCSQQDPFLVGYFLPFSWCGKVCTLWLKHPLWSQPVKCRLKLRLTNQFSVAAGYFNQNGFAAYPSCRLIKLVTTLHFILAGEQIGALSIRYSLQRLVETKTKLKV